MADLEAVRIPYAQRVHGAIIGEGTRESREETQERQHPAELQRGGGVRVGTRFDPVTPTSDTPDA
eukprot:1509087-Prymnesium_polylepis.1